MNILIRNLPRDYSEKSLLTMFEAFGEITSVNIVQDEKSGQSKGFGFVEIPHKEAGLKAIKGLNGKVIQGNKIRVKVTNAMRK